MTTTITLFNARGGIGRTRLTYHLAHMVARLGWRVLAVDLDPQANLTCAFFDDDRLELFWEPEQPHRAVGRGPAHPPARRCRDSRAP